MEALLCDKALHDLRRWIYELRLLPGEALSERRLQERLHVSRTPIRTALQTLEGEGLVQRQGRSYLVTPIDIAKVQEAVDFRMLLETTAVKTAAKRDVMPFIGDVESALKASREAGTLDEKLSRATGFHLALARCAGNRFLVNALIQIQPSIYRARFLEAVQPAGPERSYKEHARIWRHVKSGEAQEADALLREHLTRSKERLLATLTSLDLKLRAHGAEVRR